MEEIMNQESEVQEQEPVNETAADAVETDADEGAAPEADEDGQAEPEAATPESVDVQRLIAEAEQRGYLRGCNEQIEQLMARPGLWQGETDVTADGVEDEPEIMILNRIRPSIWDK